MAPRDESQDDTDNGFWAYVEAHLEEFQVAVVVAALR